MTNTIKLLYSFLLSAIMVLPALAQTDADALRLSTYDRIGTARAMGLGNAMGALGSDISVMGTNPAGIAWMRKSTISFTPTFENTNSSALLTNDSDALIWDDQTNNLKLSGLGMVGAFHQPSNSIKTFNIGLGYNTLANYDRQYYYEGSSVGSIVDRFLELSNGQSGLDEFESGVAYSAEAIYDADGNGFYESDFEKRPNSLVSKSQEAQESGSMKEINAAMAFNANEKVMVGFALGIPLMNYSVEKSYIERDENTGVEDIPAFDDLSYTEGYKLSGSGINLKIGAIFRPHQMLRLGIAYHTPTVMTISESNHHSEMAYNYTLDNTSYQGKGESPIGYFDYRLKTPARIIGSAGVILGKSGLITAEVEYANYANTRYYYEGFHEEEAEVNDQIRQSLQSAIDLRLGGEAAFGIFRLRGGLEMKQSAIVNDNTIGTSYALGAGIRAKGVFLDIAYKNALTKSTYVPYRNFEEANDQLVDLDTERGNIALTVGFRF